MRTFLKSFEFVVAGVLGNAIWSAVNLMQANDWHGPRYFYILVFTVAGVLFLALLSWAQSWFESDRRLP
ncbi:MAG: hypothetical protein ABSE51_16265 [Terracidiphilus sp.]|jgi:uncharacterized membrane protein YoaK (UPF0700 family)